MELENQFAGFIRSLNKVFESGAVECRCYLWNIDKSQRLRLAHEEILAILRRIDDLPYDDSLKDDVKAKMAEFFDYPLQKEFEE